MPTTGSSRLEEKPSGRAATSSRRPPTSSRRRHHLALLDRYLDEGNAPDPPASPDIASTSRSTGSVSPRSGSEHGRCRAAARGRQPLSGAPRVARARRVLALTASGRSSGRSRRVPLLSQRRHRHVTGSGLPLPEWLLDTFLPSRCACCGRSGPARLPGLPGVADRDPRAALRALRRSDRLAGRAVPGVLRPQARVRVGARGRCVRGSRPAAASRLEGGRAPPARADSRRDRGRARAAAGGRRHHVYPARRRPERAARPSARSRPRSRAREALGRRRRPLLTRGGRSGARRASRLDERRRNVRGAFVAAPGARAPCSWSTTSTRPVPPSAEGAAALRRAGAARVEVDLLRPCRALTSN